MTSEEQSLHIMRRQRDEYAKIYGTELDRIIKKNYNATTNPNKNKKVVFIFMVSAKTKIDAEEFILAISKLENCHFKLSKNSDKYNVMGEIKGLTAIEFTEIIFYQKLGLLFHSAMEHFCTILNYKLKYKN